MVFSRRRGLNMRPVNSLKHIIDQQGGAAPATKTDVVLVNTTDNPVNTVSNQCSIGSKVSSIFLNVQVETSAGTALNNAYFIIYKNPGNLIAPSEIPDANATGVSNFRKQVFHTEMAMLSDVGDSIPITLFKGVLRIPRKFQRMGINDTIVVQLFSPGNTIDFCVESIYKEFRFPGFL